MQKYRRFLKKKGLPVHLAPIIKLLQQKEKRSAYIHIKENRKENNSIVEENLKKFKKTALVQN
jgi:hypothetical protein